MLMSMKLDLTQIALTRPQITDSTILTIYPSIVQLSFHKIRTEIGTDSDQDSIVGCGEQNGMPFLPVSG
jgi:hypothetical protein